MISWNKLIILIFCALSLSIVNAQTIQYYKLTKIKVDGIVSSKVSGGQFICIYDGVCFDCDSKGNGIGNGQLNKQSSGEIIVYYGDSYFGIDSYYKFDKTLNKLNIITSKGDIYAYIKSTPPRGVTTCSLIKKNSNSGSGGYNYYYNNGMNTDFYPNTNNSNKSESNTNQNSNYNTPTIRKCAYCNGTGQITKNDNAPSNFRIEKPRKQCSTCGQWYDPNVFNHYHIKCSHCGGTGTAR